MKGGIAAMVVALESLRRAGVRLRGDVVFCTVTDEESSGAGGRAAVAHGVRADAGLCAEATDFDAWVACRGTVTPTITVEGRAGHAEMPQPALERRRRGERDREDRAGARRACAGCARTGARAADHRHPLLAPGDIVPVLIGGGTWIVTYPHSCSLTCDITYLPGHVDEEGTGRRVEAEVTRRLQAAVAADPWFAEHPLRIQWSDDVVPAEIPGDHPLVELALGGGRARSGAPAGSRGSTRGTTPRASRAAARPAFRSVPTASAARTRSTNASRSTALVDFCAATAVTAMRWCGVAS